MIVQYTGSKPSFSIFIRDDRGEMNRVEISKAGTDLSRFFSKKNLQGFVKNSVLLSMVEEGELRFPNDKDMEKLFNLKKNELVERMKRLSAVQDEKKNEARQSSENEAEVLRLSEENASMQKQISELQERIESILKVSGDPNEN